MADLPFVGQTHWGAPLNTAIEQRTSSERLAQQVDEPGAFRESLMSTIDTRVSDGLGDLDGADTGAAGLAVLAAALPADARQALNITVDTSVGTRVFVGDVMVHGDTGWRDVSSLVDPVWDLSGNVNSRFANFRRIGTTAILRFSAALTREASATSVISVVPSVIPGGRVELFTTLGAGRVASYSTVLVGTYVNAFHIQIRATSLINEGDVVAFEVRWEAVDPWPTTLPGTPA